ncbi:MAG: hypothetical protein Q9187_007572 [Circinaria calcarea]
MFDSFDAKIHRIQWIGWCFLALGAREPYPDWKTRLPFVVNNILIGYVFGEQTVREKVLRLKLPAGRIPDGEAYQELQPGLMVASNASGHENDGMMKASGVYLQSPSGNKYNTPAKHGFPAGVSDQALHPNRGGQCMPEASKVSGETNIALTEFANIHYSRETCSIPDAPVSGFRSLLDISQPQVGNLIHIDTPLNGRCEGILVKVEVRRIPTGEPADDMEYVVGAFGYIGNGADLSRLRGCGGGSIWISSVIFSDIFRCQQDGPDNLCYCPAYLIRFDAWTTG